MASVHFSDRTIELSVACFGPPQAGCGTNVRHLHRVVPARERTELRRVGGKERTERMWTFAYHPTDAPDLGGFDVRVRLCSVPSGQDLTLDRDAVMAGVDGILFVADARAGRTDDNIAALLDLEQLVARQGQELGALPMVFQVNQSDAQSARPTERVVEEINPFGLPVFEAMARQGKGVLESYEALMAAILARVRENVGDGALHVTATSLTRATLARAEEAVLAHAATLPQARRGTQTSLALPALAEVPVRVAELKGSRPLQHVRTEVRGERVRVEGVFRRPDGSHRKLALLLEPGADEVPVPASARREPALPPPLTASGEEVPGELSRMSYGVFGLIGGILGGLFLGYIVFA